MVYGCDGYMVRGAEIVLSSSEVQCFVDTFFPPMVSGETAQPYHSQTKFQPSRFPPSYSQQSSIFFQEMAAAKSNGCKEASQ